MSGKDGTSGGGERPKRTRLHSVVDGETPPVGASPLGLDDDQVLGGKYRLDRRLAEGGAGVVFEAGDLRTGRKVAVKVLQWWIEDERAVRRFRREAELASKLSHPHIVSVLDFGKTDDDVYYMVMERLDGADLRTHFKKAGRIEDLETLCLIVRQCTSALQCVHDAGIIHRDLKPTNIFLCGSLEAPHVKVLDFGVSKLLESDSIITERKSVLGSFGYMSPEQALGRSAEVGVGADIYALGAIIYHMLTGRPPITGDNLFDLTQRVVSEPPSPPSELRQLPDHMEAAVLKALAKVPSARQRSMTALHRELCEPGE